MTHALRCYRKINYYKYNTMAIRNDYMYVREDQLPCNSYSISNNQQALILRIISFLYFSNSLLRAESTSLCNFVVFLTRKGSKIGPHSYFTSFFMLSRQFLPQKIKSIFFLMEQCFQYIYYHLDLYFKICYKTAREYI